MLMREHVFALLLLAGASVPLAAAQAAPLMHLFSEPALSSDGRHLATLEGDENPKPGEHVIKHIVLRDLTGPADAVTTTVDTGCPTCTLSDLTWSRDGQHLAFIMRQPGDAMRRVEIVDVTGAHRQERLAFKGSLQDLRFGPDGTLAVLAIENARRDPGALQAGAPQTGEIDAQEDEQRIATVVDGHLEWQSPADLYVYEYDWRTDGPSGKATFVGTGAAGNGDNNWWLAHLFAFENGQSRLLYAPPIDQQLGLPHVSPDGRSVVFIGGLMSDFSFFGGDVFSLELDTSHAKPRNLTPGLPATVTGLSWCGSRLVASALQGAQSVFFSVGAGKPEEMGRSDDLISTGGGEPGLVCAGDQSAAVRQSFTVAPELVAGPIGRWKPLTRANADMPANAHARSVTWKSDGFTVQGWLLTPLERKPGVEHEGKVPLVTKVHGGPSGAVTPRYLATRTMNKELLDGGYDIFMPSPRGSYGQGEAFTRANRKDFGHGDLRDILRGVDAVEKIAPVDDGRLGIMGYSYGGYMTMWTVTQTNRFKAAVAGGGIANWQSYYGQNGISGWMPPFFGATVYDDPAVYAKSSPINFIRNVKTPTFIYVGANDEECPPAQSLEFYRALKFLGVPTKLVIYPGEGHGIRDPHHDQDSNERSVAWFDTYLSK